MYLSTVVQCARKVIIFRFGVPAEHHETEGPTDRVGIGFVADGGSAVAVPVRVGVGQPALAVPAVPAAAPAEPGRLLPHHLAGTRLLPCPGPGPSLSSTWFPFRQFQLNLLHMVYPFLNNPQPHLF